MYFVCFVVVFFDQEIQETHEKEMVFRGDRFWLFSIYLLMPSRFTASGLVSSANWASVKRPS